VTEWRSGRSGHLPLQDEDVTTEIKHKMKRVNTLAHYHIPDHSEMTLVRKQDNNEGVRKVHGECIRTNRTMRVSERFMVSALVQT